MFVFRKTWHALFSWNNRFDIHPFTFLLTNCLRIQCWGNGLMIAYD